MSVYRPKGSPYWHYDFVIKGRRFFGSTGTDRKAIARDVERAARVQAVQEQRLGTRPDMTLDDAFGRFYAEVAKHQAAAGGTFQIFRVLLDVLGKDTRLADLDNDKLSTMVARLRGGAGARKTKFRPKPGPRSNGTVNRHLERLRAVYYRAKKLWRVALPDQDPDWRALRLEEAGERVRELSGGEQGDLWAKLDADDRDRAEFAILSGLRQRAIDRLTWAAIDWQQQLIRYRIKSKKPGGEERQKPVTPRMLAILQRRRGSHAIFVFTYICRKSRAKRRKGERYPYSADGWRRKWREALKAAGVTNFRFHDLRHTAATRTLRAGGNLKIVQRLLDHADIASTVRYAHVELDDVRAAMLRTEQAVESRNSPEAAGTDTGETLKKTTA